MRKVATPTEHSFHVQRQSYRDQKGRQSFVEVSGGIKLKTIVLSLRAGDASVLRESVLGWRPNTHALTWTVPIDEWRIPSTKARVTPLSVTQANGWVFTLPHAQA